MKLEKIDLLKSKKEYKLAFLFFLIIFLLNLSYEYKNYLEFKKDKIYEGTYTVLNIYQKKDSFILKFKDSKISFYSKIDINIKVTKNDKIKLLIINKNISFYDYLRGFFANVIILETLKKPFSLKQKLKNLITKQHENKQLSSIYESIYLAFPMNKELRNKIASFGISHLFAISGFHLGVIVVVLYFLINILYFKIHQNFWPFRNKRFDILIFISLCLFSYLYLIDFVPSFLRAFIMFLLAFVLLRCNIKILSFKSLFITILLILALFPKYLFSLSLLFSSCGVFYIFLYLQYFKNLKYYYSFFLFNFWIFFSLNPIIHYFFPITSSYQLTSPILSILFIIFYPMSIILHLINYGDFFDVFLEKGFFLNIYTYEYETNIVFLVFYIWISFLSIKNSRSFYLLNFLFFVFNIICFSKN